MNLAPLMNQSFWSNW